jgi:hypothetical protein
MAAVELEAAVTIYRQARRDNAPQVAERLTRNVLVLVDRIPEPHASALAAAARQHVDGRRNADESDG